MSTTKAPSNTTVRKVFALSMNRCAFPDCETPIVDPVTHTITAEVCHIRAQNPGGPRYDEHQTPKQRHSAENLILMCGMHHKIIDAPENVERYSTAYLLALKVSHEERGRGSRVPALSDALLAALLASAEPKVITHMDFRGATLKAGGEGGHFGGGGGAGGVIQIVGVTPAGFHEPIDANGQDGQAPGGGGGGAGNVLYIGREGDASNIENGLRVSTFFIANSLNEQAPGLFAALGAGWSWIALAIPCPQLRVAVQTIFETGGISPDSILRIDYVVLRPDRQVALASYFDITIHPSSSPVKRCVAAFYPVFDADVGGVWKIVLTTGKHLLAEHDFEIRPA